MKISKLTKAQADKIAANGIDLDALIESAASKKSVALNTRIPALLMRRIEKSARGNVSARVRELLETALAREETASQLAPKR